METSFVFDFCVDLTYVFDLRRADKYRSGVHGEIGITNVKHNISFDSGNI